LANAKQLNKNIDRLVMIQLCSYYINDNLYILSVYNTMIYCDWIYIYKYLYIVYYIYGRLPFLHLKDGTTIDIIHV